MSAAVLFVLEFGTSGSSWLIDGLFAIDAAAMVSSAILATPPRKSWWRVKDPSDP